jgi:hypothetical protein
VSEGPIDPAQRRLAERRLLAVLRRHQRRGSLSSDLRVDTLVAEMRAAEPVRGTGHRGRQPLTLPDADLRRVVDELVANGAVLRRGHRVRLPDSGVGLDPIMRGRLDELLATLRSAGATPPLVDGVAARLGIPLALLDQLRASGELVSVAPRIDYPRDRWDEIMRRLDQLASTRSLSVSLVRDELGTARRHAEAILRHRARGQP